ncbi:hypothetical protein GA0061071_115100 [Kosakonia oryzendophytica]|uniref:Uncharacterized protein n=1 Tax=Kosakonia oryzendophytica TaxID=1005665 RepID=A0A1C4DYZ3_9ENTR|nr:hypothetical protein DFO53_2620 [Enterobacter sp. AG5470]SCC36520.1 hypothetical protein GA0061071_115100 [Kosakonia oryzendophytica]
MNMSLFSADTDDEPQAALIQQKRLFLVTVFQILNLRQTVAGIG